MQALKEQQSSIEKKEGPSDDHVVSEVAAPDEKEAELREKKDEGEIAEMEENPSSERDQSSELKRKLSDVEGGDGDAAVVKKEPEPTFAEPAAKKKPDGQKEKNLKKKKERNTRSKKQEKAGGDGDATSGLKEPEPRTRKLAAKKKPESQKEKTASKKKEKAPPKTQEKVEDKKTSE
ncbi:uncharacterized protein LOC106668892 [Cimex lectularius]|uniref:Uncharacterized protein n=1 Tax=Cimex lectularius TaxID=79782 RepID=A0A8I6TFZ8_CIMLE|nr:uncharacterized protein LOC106668892 [Cimex lectularius]